MLPNAEQGPVGLYIIARKEVIETQDGNEGLTSSLRRYPQNPANCLETRLPPIPATYNKGSELVKVVAKGGHRHLDVLTLTDLEHQLLHLAARLHGVARQVLPVVEDALRECLAAGLLTQRRHKAEGLSDWQVRLHLDEGRALTRVLLKHAAAPQVHARVDTAHGLLRARDIDQEDRLLERWLGRHLRRKAAPACRRHDLASATVDRIGVERHIHDVEADTTHVLLAQWPLLRRPLKGAVHVLLDLIEVPH